MNILEKENSILIVIDVQERLVSMLNKKVIVDKVSALTKAAAIMGVTTIATEQYPKGLGSTIDLVKSNFTNDVKIFEKTSFSALKAPGVLEALKSCGKKQVVICGIETHVCVHQSVADLINEGFDVYVVKDACASRNKYEFKQGIERMAQNGAKITCLEIVLFEWLKDAKNPNFKEVQALVK